MQNNIKKTLITLTTTLSAILIVTTATYAIGTLTPGDTPGEATQYTLNDIYTKLTTNNATSTKSGLFATPGSVVASFSTLSDIYDAIPTIDATKVATGTSYLGVAGTLVSADPGLPKTGQTTSAYANDDGDLEAGITMSYTDNSNGTITDNVTGLMWQKDDSNSYKTIPDAIAYCTALETGTYTDWRLPNIKELYSIIDFSGTIGYINPVFNIHEFDQYWSSTNDGGTEYFYVYFFDGKISKWNYDSTTQVRCVR